MNEYKNELHEETTFADIDYSDEKYVLKQVIINAIKGLFCCLIISLIIWAISSVYTKISIALFVIYVIIFGISTLHTFIFVIIPTLIIIPISVYEAFKGNSARLKKESINIFATSIKVIENLIYLAVGLWCFRLLFTN